MSDNQKVVNGDFESVWVNFSYVDMRQCAEFFWKAGIDACQAAHDAEITELRKEIAYAERCAVAQTEHAKTALEKFSAANAACAMKDEALLRADTELSGDFKPEGSLRTQIREAISATPQQASEWERKQLEPLRAQVAMLNSLITQPAVYARIADLIGVKEIVTNTQASTKQFIAECEQRGVVKALEDAALMIDSLYLEQIINLGKLPQTLLRDKAEELRATSKKAG